MCQCVTDVRSFVHQVTVNGDNRRAVLGSVNESRRISLHGGFFWVVASDSVPVLLDVSV